MWTVYIETQHFQYTKLSIFVFIQSQFLQENVQSEPTLHYRSFCHPQLLTHSPFLIGPSNGNRLSHTGLAHTVNWTGKIRSDKMPDTGSFRQVDEKHVSAEVECLQWSPKMDLIAVANVQGEVCETPSFSVTLYCLRQIANESEGRML